MEVDETVLRDWHRRLLEDRGQRAELKRVRNPLDAALVPAFHRLSARMPQTDTRRLSYIAALASHVDRNTGGGSFGAACAGHVSESRMRRLLESTDRGDLFAQISSALRLLKGAAPIGDLAEGIYYWGDSVRRRWATDYYTGGRIDE